MPIMPTTPLVTALWKSTSGSRIFADVPPGLPRAAAAPVAMPQRKRAKLWELSSSIHCSIVGTCLTAADLRRVMRKIANADITHVTDHDLHSEAVGHCSKNDPCARLLQKALDQRHETVIKRFTKLAGEPGVMLA